MKKLIARIAACSLAVLIAFNTVAIPKAEAVITESALVSAFVATYSAAAGFAYRGEPFPGTEQMPAVVRYFETVIDDFVEAYEMTEAEFEALIMSGVQYVGDGVVKIGSAAAGLLSSFTDWLVDLFALEPGSDPAVVCASAGYLQFSDGTIILLCSEEVMGTVVRTGSDNLLYNRYFSTPKKTWEGYCVHMVDPETGSTVASTNQYLDDKWNTGGYFGVGIYTSVSGEESLKVFNYNEDGSYKFSQADVGTSFGEAFGDDGVKIFDEAGQLLVSLAPDYEAAPTVDEQYAMVLDTGLTFNDEQEFVDSVLSGMLAGTLAPTYTIEQAAGGDVVVPDEGEDTDTQAGILSSVKNIAQNVIALPQTIAEAIKGIFVPDAALTTEITDAFAAKFSFVPTLHRLGTDLLSIGPDSKPPVVYIHLEDAEGAIDYGGTTKALDMSWYQRYKEDGDRIIGGFLWLGFLWLLFKRVPAIINGGEMMTEQREDLDDGYRSRRGRKH